MHIFNSFLLAALSVSGLAASTYDHYTTNVGTLSGPDAHYTYNAGFGSLHITAFAQLDRGVINNVDATVGYHDSLIIFGNGFTTGQTGILDLSYGLYNDLVFNDGGGASALFTGTGLGNSDSYNPTHQQHFDFPSVPGQITFQYGIPFSLDATLRESAGAAVGSGELRLNSLSVETASPFFYSSSSGTVYNFLDGTFTSTPEPGSILLAGMGMCLLALVRRRFTRARLQIPAYQE